MSRLAAQTTTVLAKIQDLFNQVSDRRDRGATALEYVVLAVGVVTAVVAAAAVIAGKINAHANALP